MNPLHLPRVGPGGKLDEFRAGHIFLLPEGATWLNHDKPRPFALASTCCPLQLGSMVYGSTRETERRWNTVCVEVRPNPAGVNANGLRERTFFYPGVIFPVDHAQLPAHLGFLGKSLREFRAALRRALGIGTGTCLGPGAPPRSRRGRIVLLTEDLTRDLRTPLAVLLTEHAYSRERRYHLLLPILRGESLRSLEGGVLATIKEWMKAFPQPTTTAVLPTQLLQSGWYEDDIAEETTYVIDEATLDAIESDLCVRFAF